MARIGVLHFATLYFWLNSPILAAIDTALYAVLTLVSLMSYLSLDRIAALLIAPRMAWLALAQVTLLAETRVGA